MSTAETASRSRIVIKVGTSTLTHRKSGRLNIRRMNNLVRVVADLKNSGKEIVMVSSGAVGLGLGRLGIMNRPDDTPTKQAAAAVGQCELMYMYDDQFGKYGMTVAQLLLTKTDINHERSQNVVNTLERLLSMGAIPIVNENDTVAIDELELEFGENDTLSAIVASLCKADLLILMSDIDGFFDSDPHKNPGANLIPVIDEITQEITDAAGGVGSKFGSGGMQTKLNAARIAGEAGIDMVILNGRNPDSLYDFFDGKQIGTLFRSHK